MRTIIAGSRTCTDKLQLEKALAFCGWIPTLVICGGAKGADTLGEDWAKENEIPCLKIYPNWSRYGKQAGILRNEELAKQADALIALWDGKSPGTKHMITHARCKQLKVHVHRIDL